MFRKKLSYIVLELVMPIPDFDARGLLPPFLGADAATPDRPPYRATMFELAERFATSVPRAEILLGLLKYRGFLYSKDYVVGLQFIDGSFAEHVEIIEGRDPNDIDVFSVLDPPQKYQADPALWGSSGLAEWKAEIVDRAKNKARFRVDSNGIIVSQPLGLIAACLYWSSLFAHRKNSLAWKGFVICALGAQEDSKANQFLTKKIMELQKGGADG